MDLIQTFFSWAASHFAITSSIQWCLLITGLTLVFLGIIRAVRAAKPFSYATAKFITKIGLFMVVAAFAWNYVAEIYYLALDVSGGNVVVGVLAVLAAMFFGYNTIKKILLSKKVQ